MATKWTESFDVSGASAYYTRKYATALTTSATSPGRLQGSYGQGTFTTPSLGLQNTWTFGAAFYVPSAPTATNNYVTFFRSGVEQLRVRINSSRQVEVVRGSTVLATGATTLPASTWFYLEVQATLHTSTGAYEVRINEVTEVSGTGANTAGSGSNGADAVKFVAVTDACIDDVYVNDDQGGVNDDFLGDQVVEGILPASDGASSQWTPSTGTDHYAVVDDPANSLNTSDYLSSSTVGQKEYFSMASLAYIQGGVNAVTALVMAANDSVGSRTVKTKFRSSGGSEADGDTLTVSGTNNFEQLAVWDENPVTAGAWASTEVDGGQFGFELVS